MLTLSPQPLSQPKMDDLRRRLGFEIIPRGSLEEREARERIDKHRRERDAKLGYSESESDFLYKHTPSRRVQWGRMVLDKKSGQSTLRPMMRSIIMWPVDAVWRGLIRSGCIALIFVRRFVNHIAKC